jgi:hypothetical protein
MKCRCDMDNSLLAKDTAAVVSSEMLVAGDVRSIESPLPAQISNAIDATNPKRQEKKPQRIERDRIFRMQRHASINIKTRQQISFHNKLTSISSLSPRSSQIDDIPFAFIAREDGLVRL